MISCLMDIVVEGNRGWEIMDGLNRTMSQWLGEEPTARLQQHAATIGSVSSSVFLFMRQTDNVRKGGGWKFDDPK